MVMADVQTSRAFNKDMRAGDTWRKLLLKMSANWAGTENVAGGEICPQLKWN